MLPRPFSASSIDAIEELKEIVATDEDRALNGTGGAHGRESTTRHPPARIGRMTDGFPRGRHRSAGRCLRSCAGPIGHPHDDAASPPPNLERQDTAEVLDAQVHGRPLRLHRSDGEQLKEAHERDLAIEADESVHFEHAWLDPVRGKVFCLATGPSREAVMRIHDARATRRRRSTSSWSRSDSPIRSEEAGAMHDYTAWQVHEDRMRELTREADASRLAAIAREGQPRRGPHALLRCWLSVGLARLGSVGVARAADRRRPMHRRI